MVALSFLLSSEGGDGKSRRTKSVTKPEYRDVGRTVLHVKDNENIIRSREHGIVRKIKKLEDVTRKRPNKIILKEGRLEEIRRKEVPKEKKENTEKRKHSY
jgi:hypothetical protein